MAPGEMVATVKIIAYGVAAGAVQAAQAAAAGALSLRPAVLSRAVLIQTVTAEEDGEKGRRAIQTRLAALGVALAPKVMVPHRQPDIAAALAARHGGGPDPDPDRLGHLGPERRGPGGAAAGGRAGGPLRDAGRPRQPAVPGPAGRGPGDRPARLRQKPALNGADWVMERVICGVPVTSDDIAAMGAGGLLKEVAARGRPRDPG